jgi:hypothetical protein
LGVVGTRVGHVAGQGLSTKQILATKQPDFHPIVGSLSRLHELRNQGALTDEEYTASEKKVLE